MLYHEAKKEAIAIHERAAQKYNEIYEHTKWLCENCTTQGANLSA